MHHIVNAIVLCLTVCMSIPSAALVLVLPPGACAYGPDSDYTADLAAPPPRSPKHTVNTHKHTSHQISINKWPS